MHIWHLRIQDSSLQFRASKINMALARMDKLVKKLMLNPALCSLKYFLIIRAKGLLGRTYSGRTDLIPLTGTIPLTDNYQVDSCTCPQSCRFRDDPALVNTAS